MDPISQRLLARLPQKIDLSLERMRALCAALGHPQDALGRTVHIAGTNGKGSTLAMLRAMAEAEGWSVNAYTSPHLVRFNERIRLGGRLIEDAGIERHLQTVEAAISREGIGATVFEATTALAFLAMSERPADLSLIEVGLGGRLDATNVLGEVAVSIITPVDLDHAEFLGRDVARIAAEKAGIIRARVPVICAAQGDEARDVIARAAARAGSALMLEHEDFHARIEGGRLVFQGEDRLLDLPLPALAGAHQTGNAAVAIQAAVQLGLGDEAIAAGLVQAQWPARMQRLRAGPAASIAPEVWLDGGHNPHAARALAATLNAMPARPLALVVGLLNTKDAAGYLSPLATLACPIFFTPFDAGAASAPEALAEQARALGIEAHVAGHWLEAVRRAAQAGAGRVVIAGSLYLAGEVLGADRATWPQ